jgi:glycosyltransferase involved in cell wall biosynthesis
MSVSTLLTSGPEERTHTRFSVKPLSVITVHNRYLMRGGEDEVFESEARLLQDRGCRVQAISQEMTYPSGVAGKVRVAVNAVWSKPWHDDFSSTLSEIRPDVVHVHNFFPLISPAIYYACRDAGVPVVQTLHNYRLLCPGATFYRDGHVCEDCLVHGLERSVIHGCYRDSRLGTATAAVMLKVHRQRNTWTEAVNRYIALTEFSRRKFIEGGLPADRIVVKPNFVLPDPGLGTGSRDYAIFVGRLVDLKGVPTMLAAWKRLSKPIPLVIAGDGPYRPQLEAELAGNGLSAVQYRGRLSRPETLAAIQGAKFLIFPSEWYEGFPVTIAESFACGTPVIASRLGSMPDIVADGRTGLHFEAGNADDLAQKVEWAWSNGGEIETMSRAARAEFEARYTADRNYEQLIDIYRAAIGSLNQPGGA